jgi:outer membrane protein OmpA-like peptidoglycan-associated protein
MIMRHPLAFVLVWALLAPAAARGEVPAPALFPPPADAADAADATDTRGHALKITVDRAKVDLVGHKLEVKLSSAADKVRLKVVGQSGAVLAEVEKTFGGAAAGTALVVSWTPSSEEAVAKIEVWGHDTKGYYAGVAITPWNVEIPHEDLNFESDSDVIRSADVPKLEASLQKITDVVSKNKNLGQIMLFIVGHTDTVGTPEHNITLSRKRARAIAAWFRSHGLKNPIAYEGLGESAPLVKTADEVDEARNRRAQYILSLEPPRLPSGEIAWKSL